MMWYGNDPGWGGWLLMSLGMIAFWALIAVAVIALVRASRADTPFTLRSASVTARCMTPAWCVRSI